MRGIIRAGLAYFASVFALGFLLGTIRILLVAPAVGEWTATVIELPVMLIASWLLCRWALGRWRVPPEVAARLSVGGLAFALLMVAEVSLGTGVFGRSLAEQVTTMTSGPGPLGLFSQVLFGAFPLLQRYKEPQR